MRIAVYDPFKTFTEFAKHLGKTHEVNYIDRVLKDAEREALHYHHDVVWYEFVTMEFAADTHRLPKRAYTVVRCHGFELFTPSMSQVNWDNVDRLITVSPEMCELLDRSRRTIDFPPAEILFNGVDLTMFTQPENKVYGKKIGVIGWINYKKSPPLALQCIETIAKHGYEMYFIGESQDLRYDLYLKQMRSEMGLDDKVHFLGKIPWARVPNFCRNMDYLAHTAPFESFGQALMEGIACGMLPLIHRSMGIARRFGENMTWATIAEFEELMRTYANIDDKLAVADANRRAIAEKYNFHNQLEVLTNIVSDIEREVYHGQCVGERQYV